MELFLGTLVAILCLSLTNKVLGSKSGSDMSLNRYTYDGELAQITYAGQFLSKCSPAVGFTTMGGENGILLRVKRKSHPLLAQPMSSIERAHGFAMCIVGLESDCSRVRRDWHEVVESDLFTFGELPSLEKLSGRMSAFFTRGLYQDSEEKIARPLAASTLLLQAPGNLGSNPSPTRLRVIRNTGLVYEGTFGALGSITSDIDMLERVADLVLPLVTGEGRIAPDREVLSEAVGRICDVLQEHLESKGVEEGIEFECAVCNRHGTRYALGSRDDILGILS